MKTSRYPVLYQINTRVWLTELSQRLGRAATLDDIPDTELDRLADIGFDWVWLFSVWQTGPLAQQVSWNNAEWRREFQETLPDLRERLRQRGLKRMLDFVPNHMGLGHPWVEEHPEYFVQGSELDQ